LAARIGDWQSLQSEELAGVKERFLKEHPLGLDPWGRRYTWEWIGGRVLDSSSYNNPYLNFIAGLKIRSAGPDGIRESGLLGGDDVWVPGSDVTADLDD
jgi:hypothetical protein